MPRFLNIEDAPNHLQLLNDYSKTAITLSLGLLSLSVAFAEKLLKSPADWIQASLMLALWTSLFLALVSALLIAANLTAIISNYMRGLQTAYPDALGTLAHGTAVTLGDATENLVVPDQCGQRIITDALKKMNWRTRTAYWFADLSLFMFGASAVFLAGLGFYSSIYKGRGDIGEAAAISSAVQSTKGYYNLSKDDAQLYSIGYDENGKTYVVKINSKKVAGEAYIITINGVSGRVTNASKSP
jgi:hypothetical protein